MTTLAVFANGTNTGSFAGLNVPLVIGSPVNNPPGNFPWVVVYNYSAYLLLVTVGTYQNWLEPATAASFPVPQSGSQVTLIAISNPSATPVNSNTIQAVWYDSLDGAPVGFPLALPSPLGVANVTVVSGVIQNAPLYTDSPAPTTFLTSFTNSMGLFTATGGGIIIWNADLVSAVGTVTQAYVAAGTYALVGVAADTGEADHFATYRGLPIAAGTQISSATPGSPQGFLFSMVYDQL